MKPITKKQRKRETSEEKHNVPSELLDFVLADMPSSHCPWSISGPQFAKPTDIQKRYCYSNGDASYSSHKGATLWTMVRDTGCCNLLYCVASSFSLFVFLTHQFGDDGKEDFDYRLLHVYHSSKRGFNKAK